MENWEKIDERKVDVFDIATYVALDYDFRPDADVATYVALDYACRPDADTINNIESGVLQVYRVKVTASLAGVALAETYLGGCLCYNRDVFVWGFTDHHDRLNSCHHDLACVAIADARKKYNDMAAEIGQTKGR